MGKLFENLKMKSPALLIATGCVGIACTAYSVFKSTPKYLEYVEENPDMGKLERSKAIVRHFWPSMVIGAGSAACFIGAHTIDVRRQAVLASALGVSETALLEYKTAAEEALTENDVKKIEEKIAEKRSQDDPAPESMAHEYEFRQGEVLFKEPTSGQHFWSTVETVRQAERDCLYDCMTGMFISVNEFFDKIDSPQLCHMDNGDNLGWNGEHPIKIQSMPIVQERPGVPVYHIYYQEPPTTQYSDLHGPTRWM